MDEIVWGSRIPAYAGLVLSLLGAIDQPDFFDEWPRRWLRRILPSPMAAEISAVRLIETPSADKLLCFKETNY